VMYAQLHSGWVRASAKRRAPPITNAVSICASRIARAPVKEPTKKGPSWFVELTVAPAEVALEDTTIFVRPGRTRLPSDSQVFRPIITAFRRPGDADFVARAKCRMSSFKSHGK